ncbi:UNVERIFIED_CONTAM: hypothetical protein Sradi_3340600 [Sesamum radiatum]|uniref:Reverse transcriptase/retrotransposon-derived protein RNase H-like domain-containing protein n=1 Tax=Sesamum radiatum TaxID=300843 RepID=A0AAW2R350_SESRA
MVNAFGGGGLVDMRREMEQMSIQISLLQRAKPFVVDSDASDFTLGGVLIQDATQLPLRAGS